jgi:hypothetical protein
MMDKGQKRMQRAWVGKALPGLLVLAGIALLVCGAAFHFTPVLVEEEQKAAPEVSQAAPSPTEPSPAPTQLQTIKESEPDLVREVTVGGVTLDSGEIKRTYSGKPLSKCPT